MKEIAVVLASGGLDSCVTAAIASARYELAMLHVSYGQKTEHREEQSFDTIADHYEVKHRLKSKLDHLAQIGGSSLTSDQLLIDDADLDFQGVPQTYVPFRNAHLLCIATSWAEVIGAKHLFIGAVEEDSSGYPDCTEQFLSDFNRAIRTGTRPETNIQIHAPLIHMKKAEIIAKGLELKAPLQLSWSCYRSSEKACGRCDSCALRLRGFRQAKSEDPIPYEHDEDRKRY